MAKQKTLKSWILSSFDDEDFSGPKKAKTTVGCSNKFNNADSNKKKLNKEHTVLWVEVYAPKTKNDLAVHKRKVQEVEDWIVKNVKATAAVTVQRIHRKPILLITGPSGCGKTATVKVLCQEFSIGIHEWVNPLTHCYTQLNDEQGYKEQTFGTSQKETFKSFLLRANRYQALNLGVDQTKKSEHSIVLIEDLPNMFTQNTREFHDILREYKQQDGSNPVIFIVADSSGKSSQEYKLFPQAIRNELNIENISFNSVAPTSMVKTMQRILNEESKHSPKVKMHISKVEALAECSGGDLRSAINSLQFTGCSDSAEFGPSCSSSTSTESSKSKAVGKRKGTGTKLKRIPSASISANSAVGGKDMSLYLFHALGKVLYCKRNIEADVPEKLKLVPELSHMDRLPLQFDPQEIMDRVQIAPEYFTMFLQENIPEFFTELDDIATCFDYMSASDSRILDWDSHEDQSVLDELASQVAIRGTLYSNTAVASGQWKPLHKPQYLQTNRMLEDQMEEITEMLTDDCPEEELFSDIIPFMSVIGIPSGYKKHQKTIMEIGRMRKANTGGRREQLNEKDLVEEDEIIESFPPSSQVSSASMLREDVFDDDDVLIEEFED